MYMKTFFRSPLALLLIILPALSGSCTQNRAAPRTNPSGQFELVRAHIDEWLSGASSSSLFLSPSRLQEKIVNDWDIQQNTYQIVSVRKPEDCAKAGHIPNAINSYWADLLSDDNLGLLDPDKTLILYCYYGHASMQSATILSLLGFKCLSLNFGMMGWNLDALAKEPWDIQADYPIETDSNNPKDTYPFPALASAESAVEHIIGEKAGAYFAAGNFPLIPSSEVKAIIDDWAGKKAEYQIVDARSKQEYKKGHVPHAIHIPWTEIAEPENLTMLDPQKSIIVYSGNGQTGQTAATALCLLGYKALALRFGMMDWNSRYVDPSELWKGAAEYPVVREATQP